MIKRKSSKEVLAESFREIAEKKSVDKITVADIISNCDYSKTTFYRLFKDKYDLMAWTYSRRHEEIMLKTLEEQHEWKTTLIEGAKLFDEERNYLKNLLLHTSGYESFSVYMNKLHIKSLKKCVLQATGQKKLDRETEIYINEYCYGTTKVSCDWIMGEYDLTASEIAEIYENCLPAPLRKYLL